MNEKYQIGIELGMVKKNNILFAVDSSKSVLRFILRTLAVIIRAKYVQIDGKNDLTEQVKDFQYNQSFNFEIIAKLPSGIDFDKDSARPSPSQVSMLDGKTFLKWSSESLENFSYINFSVITEQKESTICKKPEIEIESRYTAKTGRTLTIKQTLNKI